MLPQLDAGSLATSALALAGTGYAIYGGQLFLRQRWIVFKPSRSVMADPATVGLEFEDVWLPAQRNDAVHGWWINGSPGRKVFLFCCGSIGNISHEVSTLRFLASTGASVFAFDYPGFGKSQGVPGEKNCYMAVESAWRYLRRDKGIAQADIYLYGRSVGAAVAAWLAARHECAGLILQSGLTSVPDVAAFSYPLLPSRWFCLIRFNTLRYVRASKSPVLVMHSEADKIIPYRQSLKIFEHVRPPKRFIALNGDHYGNQWQLTPGLSSILRSVVEDEGRIWV